MLLAGLVLFLLVLYIKNFFRPCLELISYIETCPTNENALNEETAVAKRQFAKRVIVFGFFVKTKGQNKINKSVSFVDKN